MRVFHVKLGSVSLSMLQDRCAQLEQSIPGILTDNNVKIYQRGIDRRYAYQVPKGKISADMNGRQGNFALIENGGFTAVEMPKNHAIGNLSGAQVRAALASCGYGWSAKNKVWSCDTKGRPVTRRPWMNATGELADDGN